MESLCNENLNAPVTDILCTNFQTELNTEEKIDNNENSSEEIENNSKMKEIENSSKMEEIEDSNKMEEIEDSNKMEEIENSSKMEEIEDNSKMEDTENVMSEQLIDEPNNSEATFVNNVTKEYISDLTDNVEIPHSEQGKSENSNVDSDFDNGLEIVYDTTYQDNFLEIEYDFKHVPYQLTGSWKEFTCETRNNFTRGCKWAPDGSCILSCSDDNMLRIFNLPPQIWDSSQWHDITEMEAVVKISEGELIYDYTWYPLMNSSDPSTCCLASASKNSTVHLWDGFTGELRCSYRTYNPMDEIVTPYSLSFDSDGQKLFCGFEKVVRVFNVDTPGRNFEERYTFAKKSGQSGIISCFAFTSFNKNISAAGSYQKTIGIYSEPSGNLECLLEGQKGGITQLQFSHDGVCLYSGGRKDSEILCWDLRNLGTVLFSLRRSCATNQRMYFDISRCGRYVASGNQNGVITIWDVTKEPKIINEEEFAVLEPTQFFIGHDDCVNGISLHPMFPLLCSSSGQRKFPTLLSDDDDGMFSPKIDKRDNSLRLWWLGKSD